MVKRHGNWLSDAVHVYIIDSIEMKLAVSAAVFQPSAQGAGIPPKG